MQADGNLVHYDGSTAIWQSRTTDDGSVAVMQTDGNLVIYRGSAVRWQSATTGFGGATLKLQDDGNLVIYSGGRPIWNRSAGYTGHVLEPRQELGPGEMIRSPGGAYRLIMQTDGKLALYRGSSSIWETRANGAGSRTVMQANGNLVVYNGGAAPWDSNGTGFNGASLIIQDDGNAVVYHSGHAIWTWRTGYVGDQLLSGATLAPGAYLKSADKRYTLLMQASDGNLALYGPSGSLWSFGTTGHPGARAIMQSDGNLVVYSGAAAVESTRTGGHPGAVLRVQDDTNVVVYAANQAPLWNRFTGTAGGAADSFSYPLGSGNSASEYPISQSYCEDGVGLGPHLGVDWAAGSGTPVHALANGVVVDARWMSGYGNTVRLRHSLPNGETWYTLYGHMRDPANIAAGQSVTRRQQIGLVGNTGLSVGDGGGYHLHLAVSASASVPRGYGRPCPGAYGTSDPIAFINSH